jgi:hypothetical protein
MANDSQNPSGKTPPSAKPKAAYEKPRLRTEKLTAVAALCNGTASGGRKASTGAPSFCAANKLKS